MAQRTAQEREKLQQFARNLDDIEASGAQVLSSLSDQGSRMKVCSMHWGGLEGLDKGGTGGPAQGAGPDERDGDVGIAAAGD